MSDSVSDTVPDMKLRAMILKEMRKQLHETADPDDSSGGAEAEDTSQQPGSRIDTRSDDKSAGDSSSLHRSVRSTGTEDEREERFLKRLSTSDFSEARSVWYTIMKNVIAPKVHKILEAGETFNGDGAFVLLDRVIGGSVPNGTDYRLGYGPAGKGWGWGGWPYDAPTRDSHSPGVMVPWYSNDFRYALLGDCLSMNYAVDPDADAETRWHACVKHHRNTRAPFGGPTAWMYEPDDDPSTLSKIGDLFDTGGIFDWSDLDRAQVLRYTSMVGDDLGEWVTNLLGPLCNRAVKVNGPWTWHNMYTAGDFEFEFKRGYGKPVSAVSVWITDEGIRKNLE